MNQQTTSLTIVGAGIKFLSHLTIEAKAHIEQADRVLYLVNNPMLKQWIHEINAQSESLDEIYNKHRLRHKSYDAITQHILAVLRKGRNICVVLYGHPTVFAEPALKAAILAEREGYKTTILPGISAEDCLFADLKIDPAQTGCQSFEATDFLLYRRPFSCQSHLILWQPNIIGAVNHPVSHDNKAGITLLVEYLSSQYQLDYEVVIYEAAQIPMFEPMILKLTLKDLLEKELPRVCILYIPPISKSNIDLATLRSLGIKLSDLN